MVDAPSAASETIAPRRAPNAGREKRSCTRRRAATPSAAALLGASSVRIAAAKAPGVGSHRKPTSPAAPMLSHGPPLLQATTGRAAAIASSGTIPKCSRSGVYSTAVHAASSQARCSSVNEGKKRTASGPRPRSAASACSSARCSTFSGSRLSYPPAITRRGPAPSASPRSARSSASARSARASPFLRSKRLMDRKTGPPDRKSAHSLPIPAAQLSAALRRSFSDGTATAG
mmetsp:Transcript_21580/g.54369  ORF Transcript_21580/g.54369 Transcript_21580/m.54369 type:complete len:231 (-) Transcript_21580:527-1219(-)